MAQRSETFGRLLKAGIGSIANCEGKTAPVIEDELGQQVSRAHTAIQRYKSGYLPPEAGIVQILAEACVKRGLMSRSWLEQFLHAARYPTPQELTNKLCPIGPQREKPPRAYTNLPGAVYSHFVMREQAFADVVDGLNRRSAVVLIASLGGMGKTSLAREIAARSLMQQAEVPQFDAVVWLSDKDRPGTTNLSISLDTIAQTLDYPGFTQFAHDEKRYEVEQLLRRQRVLLVVDNFETITDGALLQWLLRLPEPSKVLITTREYRREFRNSAIAVDLRGMTDHEAHALVVERLKLLRLDTLVKRHEQFAPLIMASGGNPKVIELTLGLIKNGRTMTQVVEDLHAARGDIFTDLFERAWSLLDEASRKVLLATPLFVDNASSAALAHCADVVGVDFDHTIEHLIDLALLDEQRDDLDVPARYTTHTLVRAFATAKLAERPAFEQEARMRWVSWAYQLMSRTNTCWDDNVNFEVLDSDYNTYYAAIEWVAYNTDDVEMFEQLDMAECFYYGRGHWDKLKKMYLLMVHAARRLKIPQEEMHGLRDTIKLLSLKGEIAQVEPYMARLNELAQQTSLSDHDRLLMAHIIASHHLARDDFENAYQTWIVVQDLSDQLSIWLDVSYYVAVCLRKKGDLSRARGLLLKVLSRAIERSDKFNILNAQFTLAEIDLDENNIASANKRLHHMARIKNRHRDFVARIHRLTARYHIACGDIVAAHREIHSAVDIFERLGMHRELAEACTEMTILEASCSDGISLSEISDDKP